MEYLSEEKYKELVGELNSLKTTKRKEIADNLEYAKSLGDLSENAEYLQAREDQVKVEERISKLEEILRNAEVVSKSHGAIIEVGTKVKVSKEDDKKEFTFLIAGTEESDMVTGKISIKSPLGMALMGKKKGDKVTFKSPKGTVNYIILSVE